MLDARQASAVRVLAPDAIHLDARSMRALGVERLPGARRGAHLDHCRHMVATRADRPVGFAAFELTHDQDLLVHELSAAQGDNDVISALVLALELACLAAGGTRLLISSRAAIPPARLVSFGYEPAPWNGWLQKRVP